MTARQRLHQIVEELPEAEAERVLRAVERWRDDPVGLALASAPFEDEHEPPEDQGSSRRLATSCDGVTSSDRRSSGASAEDADPGRVYEREFEAFGS